MYCFTKSEDELFSDITRFSKLFITLQHALVALSDIRESLLADERSDTPAYPSLCKGFENLVASLKGVRDEIGSCDLDHLPALIFLEFSPALHYVLRRVRRALPPIYGNDPVQDTLDKLDELKDLCRPEKRDPSLTNEKFREGVADAVDGMIRSGCKIAALIRSVAAERGLSRPPTPTAAALGRLETTAEETNETVHRLDNRDRRHRQEAGKGGAIALSVQRKCAELWRECKVHPEWFGDAALARRITKRMAYDYLTRHALLPSAIDSLKTFVRAIDSARKLPPIAPLARE